MNVLTNMRLGVLAVALQLLAVAALAQEAESRRAARWDFGLEGMLGVSAGPDFYALNVGGPSLLLQVHRHWKVGFGALPSFYVKEGSTGAKLGVSPRVDYKSFVLIAPFFHFEQSDRWVWSVGLGYKFHRRK